MADTGDELDFKKLSKKLDRRFCNSDRESCLNNIKTLLLPYNDEERFKILDPCDGKKHILFKAVQLRYLDVMEYLLKDCKVNVDIVTDCRDGRSPLGLGYSFDVTPLFYACMVDDLEIVKFLLEKGANIFWTNDNDQMPIHAAICKGHIQVVEYLMEQIGEIDVRDSASFLAFLPNEQILNYLLSKGFDPNAKDSMGFTSLHCALDWTGKLFTRESNYKTVLMLLHAGADFNIKDDEGLDAIVTAAKEGDKMSFYLLSSQASANQMSVINGLEVLGAMDVFNEEQDDRAHGYWLRALFLRYSNPTNPVLKPVLEPKEIFDFVTEFQTFDELEALKDQNSLLKFNQAALILERVIGWSHPFTLYEITKTFASKVLRRGDYRRSFNMFKYARRGYLEWDALESRSVSTMESLVKVIYKSTKSMDFDEDPFVMLNRLLNQEEEPAVENFFEQDAVDLLNLILNQGKEFVEDIDALIYELKKKNEKAGEIINGNCFEETSKHGNNETCEIKTTGSEGQTDIKAMVENQTEVTSMRTDSEGQTDDKAMVENQTEVTSMETDSEKTHQISSTGTSIEDERKFDKSSKAMPSLVNSSDKLEKLENSERSIGDLHKGEWGQKTSFEHGEEKCMNETSSVEEESASQNIVEKMSDKDEEKSFALNCNDRKYMMSKNNIAENECRSATEKSPVISGECQIDAMSCNKISDTETCFYEKEVKENNCSLEVKEAHVQENEQTPKNESCEENTKYSQFSPCELDDRIRQHKEDLGKLFNCSLNLFFYLLAVGNLKFNKITENLFRQFISEDFRGCDGESLLHSVSFLSSHYEVTGKIKHLYKIRYPMIIALLDYLLRYEAEIDSFDDDGNTPLHYALRPFKKLETYKGVTIKTTVKKLLSHGAHLDYRNYDGECTLDVLREMDSDVDEVKNITLQCLAAKAVMRHQLKFEDHVPEHLYCFLDSHWDGHNY